MLLFVIQFESKHNPNAAVSNKVRDTNPLHLPASCRRTTIHISGLAEITHVAAGLTHGRLGEAGAVICSYSTGRVLMRARIILVRAD